MYSLNKKTQNESGFTLVELLVVILIIGVLAAIAIPAFMNQRVKANDATLQSDLKNAASAVVSWQASGETWKQMRERVGRTSGSFVVKSDDLKPSNLDNFGTQAFWNNHDLPKITVSSGVWVEVVSFKTGESGNAAWHGSHDAEEFCIVGAKENSTYDFHRGTHTDADYERLLYYDQKMGGIVELDDIIEEVNSNGSDAAACYAYAELSSS